MAPISIWMSGCVTWISKKETGILHTVAISIETFVRVSALYLLEIFLEITDIKAQPITAMKEIRTPINPILAPVPTII